MMTRKKIKAMSLFANVGVAEAYLSETDVDVVIANELEKDRVEFYHHLYPDVNIIPGDITDKAVKNKLINEAKANRISLIMATPPCQGMSTAGKKKKEDPRNKLICDAIEIVKSVKPKYVMFENVPEQLITYIKINNNEILIPDYIKKELGSSYEIKQQVVNAADYGVPQSRERVIFLLTEKKAKAIWDFPSPDKQQKTMKDAIGMLPILDPLISDVDEKEQNKIFPKYLQRKIAAEKISKWHVPPTHVKRQVIAMMHTPTGKSAFENIDEFKPRKKDGNIVSGYKNTYKRQEWDKPAFTVTMYNRTIGSQNNVHPGRFLGEDSEGNAIYSDPRVLTIYELMLVMSLPGDWNIPEGFSESFVRSVIGEGIPPLLVKRIMEALP